MRALALYGMTKHLRVDLESLEKQILLLGARVEDAVRKSILAITGDDKDLARAVVAGDEAIDGEEVRLEDFCLKILALHQPVANDLRFVTSVLKINSDLERIGDLAANIAKRTLELPEGGKGAAPPRLHELTEVTVGMLRESLDAFVRADVRLARRVLAEDQLVDDGNKEIVHRTIELLSKGEGDVGTLVLYMSASKNLERIADHATNIAEDVVFMVEGEIIRHKGPED